MIERGVGRLKRKGKAEAMPFVVSVGWCQGPRIKERITNLLARVLFAMKRDFVGILWKQSLLSGPMPVFGEENEGSPQEIVRPSRPLFTNNNH